MADSLGYRMKFGVLAPSTNTSVQPEFDGMRPAGITNHFDRIAIPDNPINSDEDFNKLMDDIRAERRTRRKKSRYGFRCLPGSTTKIR